jgi:hypothetical protein
MTAPERPGSAVRGALREGDTRDTEFAGPLPRRKILVGGGRCAALPGLGASHRTGPRRATGTRRRRTGVNSTRSARRLPCRELLEVCRPISANDNRGHVQPSNRSNADLTRSCMCETSNPWRAWRARLRSHAARLRQRATARAIPDRRRHAVPARCQLLASGRSGPTLGAHLVGEGRERLRNLRMARRAGAA